MALHFSSGIGDIMHHLIESDSTIYTRQKWWGEFSTTDKISGTGDYRIEMEDGRMGDCIFTVNTDHRNKLSNHFNFFGRGKLGGTKTYYYVKLFFLLGG